MASAPELEPLALQQRINDARSRHNRSLAYGIPLLVGILSGYAEIF
jgi:hypothetical protein